MNFKKQVLRLKRAQEINEKYQKYYEYCQKTFDRIEKDCYRNLKMFLKILGFKQKDRIWQRNIRGYIETVNFGVNYVGVYVDEPENASEEVREKVYQRSRELQEIFGNLTVSFYGFGGEYSEETGQLTCNEIYDWLWNVFGDEVEEISDRMLEGGVDDNE